MKHYLQQVFEYIGRPENFSVSIILIVLYTLFVVIVGVCIAWVWFIIATRKDKPVSFDDYGYDIKIHRIKRLK